MANLLPRDLRDTPAYADVQRWLAAAGGAAPGELTDIRDLAASPDGALLAFTAWVRGDGGAPQPRIGVTASAPAPGRKRDGTAGGIRLLRPAGLPRRQPAWSPDGRTLACLEGDGAGLDRVVLLDGRDPGAAPVPVTAAGLRGSVEACCWSPDGSRLLLLAAEPGAEISDVFGSGRVPERDGLLPTWLPMVAADGLAGWRRLWVWDRSSGGGSAVDAGVNIWEADWAGPDAVCALVSAGPAEDDWYDARWARIELPGGLCTDLGVAEFQLALPRSNPAGTALSVITGRASDRGLVAGGLLVRTDMAGPHDAGTAQVIDTLGADVTDHRWRDDRRLVFAGMRGLESAVGEFDRETRTSRQLWSGQESIGPGDLLPAVSPAGPGDAVAVVLESHARPPTAGLITGAAFRAAAASDDAGAHAGSALVIAAAGAPQVLDWDSPDGTAITGLLYRPASGPGRGLVVMVHGGPIWCWRDVWPARLPLIGLLASRGFAVLLPNIRGSQGRGAAFTGAIVGEIGGRDVQDVLSGVDAALAAGIGQPGAAQPVTAPRVAVLGSSYGGFLAAYLATVPGRFAAAVAISPATEWISQHYTTNIPASDLRFLTGAPLDPASQYASRSALRAVTAATAPVLLTAGALDLATPPAQALMFCRALAEQGVHADLAIYPEEGHDVHQQDAIADQSTRIVMWLERYLPDVGD